MATGMAVADLEQGGRQETSQSDQVVGHPPANAASATAVRAAASSAARPADASPAPTSSAPSTEEEEEEAVAPQEVLAPAAYASASAARPRLSTLDSIATARSIVDTFANLRRQGRLRSTWRWPKQAGEIPSYVQRNFRVKALGFVSVQLAVIFGLMVLVHIWFPASVIVSEEQGLGGWISYGLGAVTVGEVVALHMLSSRYPANYVLLAVLTLTVGVFWGLGPFSFGAYLNFQLVGILALAMTVSTIAVGVFTRDGVDPWKVLLGSQYLGWLVGSAVDACIVTAFGLSSMWMTLLAATVALALLMVVFLLDAGRLLIKCNPDDFMNVLICMDSVLLVVSMPIFLLSCCMMYASQDEPGPPVAPPIPAGAVGAGGGAAAAGSAGPGAEGP